MSAGGKALAQAVGQFGQSFKEMGETIYKVEADNEFRNQSLSIADSIEKFNADLRTDPDHGTPGEPDGYMKKWDDFKKSIDARIQQVKNPLAKKNLEAYVTQASTSQYGKVYELQYAGWSNSMVADAKRRIQLIIANEGVQTQFKLDAMSEELDGLRRYNILSPQEIDEIRLASAREIVASDFVRTSIHIAETQGIGMARKHILKAGYEYHPIGKDLVAVTSGDIEKAFTLASLATKGDEDLGEDEYNTFYNKVQAKTATIQDFEKVLASKNITGSRKTQAINAWYGSQGDKEALSAILGVGRVLAMANGEAVEGKLTTWRDIEALAQSGSIDASTLSHLQNVFLEAKVKIRSSSESDAMKSLMLDIVDGKVKSLTEAILRAPQGKEDQARVLYLQTTAANEEDAQVKVNNEATAKLAEIEKRIRNNEATEEDFLDFEAWVKDNRDALGSGYQGVNGRFQELGWKYKDAVSLSVRGTLEQKIRQDPSSVSDSEIWAPGMNVQDSGYLATLRLQGKKESERTSEESATKDIIDRYGINQKQKRGDSLTPGEKPLTREELTLYREKLPATVYQAYADQLDRDLAEQAGLESYWTLLPQAMEGSLDVLALSNRKDIPFNLKVDLYQKASSKGEDEELKDVSTWALHLVRSLNGQSLSPEEHVLTYEDLPGIKSARAYSVATSALSASVEFLRAKGKNESFLKAYRGIVEGKMAKGTDILSNAQLEPQDRIQLYEFYVSTERQKKLEEREEIRWIRENDRWLEDKRTKEGFGHINAVYGKILSGTLSEKEIDDLPLADSQKIEVKAQVAQNARYVQGKTKEDLQEANAFRVHEKFLLAKKTAQGLLADGEKGLSLTEFSEYLASFGIEGIPLSIRRFYQDLADQLDETRQADALDKRIRDAGRQWIDAGSVDEKAYTAISAEIEASSLQDKSGARSLLAAYESNAKAAGRQIADDAYINSQRARTVGEQNRQAAEQEAKDIRKAKAQEVRSRFIDSLNRGMSEAEYLTFQAEYEEVFKDAPAEFTSAFHPLDVLYQGKTDAEYQKKDGILQDAFDELVNASMIEGWVSTGESLSIPLIKKLFPSDSQGDLKGRTYWTEKLRNFQKSEEAMYAARTASITALSEARANAWAGLSGLETFDPDIPVLTPELIKEHYPNLRASDRSAFLEDVDSINRAISAKRDAEQRAKEGASATQAEKSKGNDIYQRLEGLASTLELANMTMGSVPGMVAFPKRDGTVIKLEASQETFDAILNLYAGELITAGKWGEAVALKKKFTGKIGDPVWEPVSLAIKNLTEGGKKPQNYPPAVKKWVESEIAQTKNPTPEYINKLVEGITKKSININLTRTFQLQENTPDVSEDYLARMYAGEWEPFVGDVNGVMGATSPYFTDTLNAWAKKTLQTMNFTAGKDLFTDGNVKREIYANGHVEYVVSDKATLASAGIAGDRAVYYLGFYGNDALPIREVTKGQIKKIQVFVPWEKETRTASQGRWIDGYATTDPNGVIRYVKTASQVEQDVKKPPIVNHEVPMGKKALYTYQPFVP